MSSTWRFLPWPVLCHAQDASTYAVNDHHIVYHDVRVDASGVILPWYSDDPAQAYDHDIRRFGTPGSICGSAGMGSDYLQHQVWKETRRSRGRGTRSIGADSWNLLYDYLGDHAILDNMVLIANYWLDHGMSSPTSL